MGFVIIGIFNGFIIIVLILFIIDLNFDIYGKKVKIIIEFIWFSWGF